MIQKKYKDYLKEHAISRENLNKYENALKNIGDFKNNSILLQNLIFELKNDISTSNENIISFRKYDEDDNKIYLGLRFNFNISTLITKIEQFLIQSKDTEIFNKYFSIIYPDGDETPFNIEIDIEKNNLNRIHIPVGLPFILKGVGLGKKIYKSLINEYKFISTNGSDRNMDALFIWDSLCQDKNVYSFINDKKILSISPELEFEKIKDILLIFFNDVNDQYIVLDDDFKNKYNKELMKSELRKIREYEIKYNL